jgi:hypothetical protein
MPEVPHARKYHRQTQPVRRGDDFFIAHRTAGPDDRRHAASNALR